MGARQSVMIVHALLIGLETSVRPRMCAIQGAWIFTKGWTRPMAVIVARRLRMLPCEVNLKALTNDRG